MLTDGPCDSELSVRPRRSHSEIVNAAVAAVWEGCPSSLLVAGAALQFQSFLEQ